MSCLFYGGKHNRSQQNSHACIPLNMFLLDTFAGHGFVDVPTVYWFLRYVWINGYVD
jgi:hypothetical protein